MQFQKHRSYKPTIKTTFSPNNDDEYSFCVHAKLLQSCLTLHPQGLQPARLLCPWDSPGKYTGVGCHALLQGSFPTQESNPRFFYLPVLARRFFTASATWGFPGGSDSKESTCSTGDPTLIPGWGRSPREGNSSPLQYTCLENSMDREARQALVHGVARVGHYLATKPLLTF